MPKRILLLAAWQEGRDFAKKYQGVKSFAPGVVKEQFDIFWKYNEWVHEQYANKTEAYGDFKDGIRSVRRKNPLEEIILGKVADLAVSHYTKKKTKKKKNPAAFGSFIPIRVVGNKVQIKVPNRNPGTLAQAKAIAKKLGVRTNPPKSKARYSKVELIETFHTKTQAEASKRWHKAHGFGKLKVSGPSFNGYYFLYGAIDYNYEGSRSLP